MEKEEGWRGQIQTKKSPCLVDEMAREHLESQMRAAVEEWIKENPDEMKVAVNRAIEEGAWALMQAAMDRRFEAVAGTMVSVMQTHGLLPKGPNQGY